MIKICLIALFLLSLMPKGAYSAQQVLPLASYSGLIPANSYVLGIVSASDTIKVILRWTNPSRPTTTAKLHFVPGITTYVELPLSSSEIASTANSFIFEKIAP